MKIKSSRNGDIILLFTDFGKRNLVAACFNVANTCMCSNAIHDNKFLAKISECTVFIAYESSRTAHTSICLRTVSPAHSQLANIKIFMKMKAGPTRQLRVYVL